MQADTWGVVLIIDENDEHVLAEAVVGLKEAKGKHVIAQPPVTIEITQTGIPGYLVFTNLKGTEVTRQDYGTATRRSDGVLHSGDALRLMRLQVTTKP